MGVDIFSLRNKMAAPKNPLAQMDPEIAQAFAELSMKKAQAENQIRVNQAQIENLSRKIQHSNLVEHEMKGLPEDVKTFKSVGRMFLLTKQENILKDLKSKKENCNEKIKSLEKSKDYLEKNIEECKNNVRELVMSKQNSR